MAKKESEISVEERLKTLYQLQTTLSSIDEKRALRGELPLEVQDLEDEIAGLKTRVEHIEGDIVSFQQAVAQKQGEIAEAEESVERYKKQLDEVRNNREYDTLTKEIEFQSLEIELCNKKIKEANVKVEDKKRELAHTNDLIADRQQALVEKKNELDEIMQETREEEEVLKAKAAELETKIEPRLLSSFLRIRKNLRFQPPERKPLPSRFLRGQAVLYPVPCRSCAVPLPAGCAATLCRPSSSAVPHGIRSSEAP